MPLSAGKAAFIAQIKAAQATAMADDTTAGRDKFAEDLADAIETFILSAQVNSGIVGTATDPISGTLPTVTTGTGTLS